MRISKLSQVTKFILDELHEKQTVFDLKEKVSLKLPALRQTIVRLMEHDFVFVFEQKTDKIRKRKMKYYKITNKGKEFIKKVENFVLEKKEEIEDKKRFIFGNEASRQKTKAFIGTLTKKATPWDALLLKDRNA